MYDLAVGGDEDEDVFLGDDSDDIMLGDDDLLVGGMRHRKRRHLKVKRIQPGAQTQILNFPQGPNGATTFTASLTGVVTARPQRVFQTKRFVVASIIAPFFALGDLLIGRDSMLVNSELMSAEVFSQTGVGVGLEGFIARPGIDITLAVTNLDAGASHAFYASIIGPALV